MMYSFYQIKLNAHYVTKTIILITVRYVAEGIIRCVGVVIKQPKVTR